MPDGLKDKSDRELLVEMYTVMLGVPGTEDTGMAGSFKSLNGQVQGISRAVQVNTTWRKALAWVVGVIIMALGVLGGMVISG